MTELDEAERAGAASRPVTTALPASQDPERLAELRHQVIGDVLLPEEPGFERHRQVYNAAIDKRPALIVVCEGAADVQAAVRFAAAAGLSVGIRGGGHSIAGHGTCDGGLLVDLRRMRGVLVHPEDRTVWVQGGATLRDLDAQTQLYGLAVPTGQVSATGIAGLTLGGGLGMLQRRFGLTCDNLLRARLVTADGGLVEASAEEHSELFWALRGGGGNFGVVTDFCFRAHAVGPLMVAGMIAWPTERADEVLQLLDRTIADAPVELSADVIFQYAPPLSAFPEELIGRPLIGIFIRWSGEIADGLQVTERFRSGLPDPVLDVVGPMPMAEVQRMLDPLNPDGNHHHWTGEFVRTMDSQTRAALADLGSALPTPISIIEVIPYNAAVTRVGVDQTAFSHRTESWLVHILGQWSDAGDAGHVSAWVRRAKQTLGPLGFGGETYLNLINDAESAQRVTAFWQDRRRERLAEVKLGYDPGNTFRFNHNIPGWRSS